MRGYTLIEVLVVIVISSIILSSSTFFLRNSINVTSELKKINSLNINNIHFQSLLRNFLYNQYFDKFWGIGTQQTKYAKSVGFKENEIRTDRKKG